MAVIEAIATTYLEADVASVTFSAIPQTYEHLQLRMSGKLGRSNHEGEMLINGVSSGSVYSRHRMGGSGSSTNAWASTSADYIVGPYFSGTGAGAANYAVSIVDILDYTNTNKNMTMMYMTYEQGTPNLYFGSALWDGTAAVTSLTYRITPTVSELLTRGSVITLYGLNSS